MHDTHRKLCIRTISDDRSISTIIIKKSLKEILQISKGMACYLGSKHGILMLTLIEI